MMLLALLLVCLVFGRLVVSTGMLAVGVIAELTAYGLRLVAFVLHRLVGSFVRRRVRGPASIPASSQSPSGTTPSYGIRPVRRPRWWNGLPARSDADFASLLRGIEAAQESRDDASSDRR